MQLFTKNIWRKAKYYVILQPIKNIFKILLSFSYHKESFKLLDKGI